MRAGSSLFLIVALNILAALTLASLVPAICAGAPQGASLAIAVLNEAEYPVCHFSMICSGATKVEVGQLRDQNHQASECDALYTNTDNLYHEARYDEALQEGIKSLLCYQEAQNQVGEGLAYISIAAAYERKGQYGQAIENFQKGLAVAKANQNPDGESAALNGLAVVYTDQARYDKALNMLQQALAIKQKAGDQEETATILSNIGIVYREKQSFPEALQYHQQALTIYQAIGNKKGIADSLQNLGMVYHYQLRYPEALKAFDDALNIYTELKDSSDQANTLIGLGLNSAEQKRFKEALDYFKQGSEIMHAIGDHAGEAQALSSMGGILADEGQSQEAITTYLQALDALDEIRQVNGSIEGQASYIAQYASVYRDTIRVLLKVGRQMEAFDVTERGRARTFLDSLATGHVQLTDAEQVQLVKQGSVLSLTQVQLLLDDQTTLVSYWVLGGLGSLAFIITRDSFTMIKLPMATADNLVREIVAIKPAFGDANVAHPQPLQDLSEWLIKPIAGYLTTRRVGIIPHQMLHYVPFSALTVGDKYFSEEYQLFWLPSASVLPFIQKNSSKSNPTTQGAIIFGDPTSDESQLTPLPQAAIEAQDISTLLKVQTVYLAEKASESRLQSAAGDAGIIHLAAHADYNIRNPLYSVIYLAPGGGQDGKLEVHEIYGLALKNAQLVVLSACETNTPLLVDWKNQAVSPGDELVGFTRAFFYAGAPTVITSLWTVADKQTRELMVAFYNYWQNGMDKAVAFQQAQADVRSQYPSPYYWASFVLNGDPGGKFIPAKQQPLTTQTSKTNIKPICSTWVLALVVTLLAVFRALLGRSRR
jgi:CHAT domain-containing protein/Tfp pilus assembly protein PilF